MKATLRNSPYLLLLCAIFAVHISAQSTAPDSTTAWRGGRFQVDVAGVLSRSSIILGQPNTEPAQAMPLGNGSLGVAIWSDNGITAQLNRADTLPDRLSTGEVVVPGLAALTHAKNYAGQLNLYDGEFREQGAGMTATTYVQPDKDTLIIDVTGANANETQTAQLRLWAPRTTELLPKETWACCRRPGPTTKSQALPDEHLDPFQRLPHRVAMFLLRLQIR